MSVARAFVTICMLTIFLVACSKPIAPAKNVGFCAVGAIPNATCQHEIADRVLTFYSSSPAMPEETAIDLFVELPVEWNIERSHLAGESMYMGTIPVTWSLLENGRWLAKIRLGACTDPQMIWRLTLLLATEEGQATAHVSFPVAAHP